MVQLAAGLDARNRLAEDAQQRALGVPGAVRPAPAPHSAGAVAHRRHQHPAPGAQQRRVSDPGRGGAGAQRRDHQRPGRSAADLSGCRAQRRRRDGPATGGGHRRRQHRIHHRRKVRAAAPGQPADGVRQPEPGLFRRWPDHRGPDARGGIDRATADGAGARGVSGTGLGGGDRGLGFDQGDSGGGDAGRLVPRGHHPGGVAAAADRSAGSRATRGPSPRAGNWSRRGRGCSPAASGCCTGCARR